MAEENRANTSQPTAAELIDYVNRDHPLRGLATKFSLVVRRRFYDLFMQNLDPKPGDTILDVGVTPDQSLEDSNYLERWYPYPERITATSIEDAGHLEVLHPGLRFVQTSGTRLPFADRQFDICFSTAVIEHVGSRTDQFNFVKELLRVSKRFFLTTPNRGFPLELHTFLPLIHWLPQNQHQWLLRHFGQDEWSTTENLNLLNKRDLRALFPKELDLTISGVRFFGLQSNLVAHGCSTSRHVAGICDGGAALR
jgi:SAM-dependent methyltransferase